MSSVKEYAIMQLVITCKHDYPSSIKHKQSMSHVLLQPKINIQQAKKLSTEISYAHIMQASLFFLSSFSSVDRDTPSPRPIYADRHGVQNTKYKRCKGNKSAGKPETVSRSTNRFSAGFAISSLSDLNLPCHPSVSNTVGVNSMHGKTYD